LHVCFTWHERFLESDKRALDDYSDAVILPEVAPGRPAARTKMTRVPDTSDDQAAVTIRVLRADDSGDEAVLLDLRARVLRPGQPPERSRFAGDDDPNSVHLGAFVAGRCVGVASLLPEAGLRLRGMAVEADVRGTGVGAALLGRVHQIAEERGQDLWCNARKVAVGFYQKYGWTIEGSEFSIPEIGPHYVMRWRRSLKQEGL
jgi:GNAT superfamily N-acetyltransferase